ncbi:PREDICTED: C-type lectin domain family 4 member E-like [Cyprinodon variegatus]|uniref:C-type lectin domain family 4 member E-like n=1 Tax=Cyprinodon variegatus TaxID=28743 RepID=UPI000742B9E0|nr:PREDICTED: C-type lectin domain family 4 member E-like [Cyprinodon variegatus]
MVQTLEEENEALKEENGDLRRNISDEAYWKCEAGWELHGGKCYYFSTNKSSWKESRRLCKDLGGDLVKIDSRDEQIFIEEKLVHMMKNNEDKFWIGLTDSEEEGRWLWVDGSPLNTSLSFWTDGQPDNWSKYILKQADCVRMGLKEGSDGLKSWSDMSCDAHQKSICEKAEKTR